MVSMCAYIYIHTHIACRICSVFMLLHICFTHIYHIWYVTYIYTHMCDSCILLILCVTCICCLSIYIYLLWICACIYTFTICIQKKYIHLNILPRTWWDNILYQRLQVDVNKWVCLNMCCTSQNKTGCLFADQSYDIQTHLKFRGACRWIEVIGRFITRLIGALVTMFTCLPSLEVWNQLITMESAATTEATILSIHLSFSKTWRGSIFHDLSVAVPEKRSNRSNSCWWLQRDFSLQGGHLDS